MTSLSSVPPGEGPRTAPWLENLEEVEEGEPVLIWEEQALDVPRSADFPVVGVPEPEPEPEPVDLEALEEEARQRGYETGYEAGYTAGHQEGWGAAEAAAAEAFTGVGGAAEQLEILGGELEDRCVGAAVELALRIARRIVGWEVAQAPAGMVAAVRSAIATLRGAASVVVTVHPDDLPALRSGKALEGTREGLVRIQLVGDAELARGGWRVDSRVGGVDGTLETRIAAVAERLAKVDIRWEEPEPDESSEETDAPVG